MKAVDSHLLTLLKASSQFIVPIYQRLYSWQEPECSQLWSDIVRAGSDKNLGAHFTGSIVYVAREQSTNTSAEPDLLIDGQQRVTTVTLILAALVAHLKELPVNDQEPREGFSPRKIRNRFLINDDEDGDKQYKLLLSQSDRDALLSIVQGLEPQPDESNQVITNYLYFRDLLKQRTSDLATVCAGLDKLIVVDVKLERGIDNPQLVFEAMNSTGKKLTQADLIRNFVLMDLPPREQERIYTHIWRPMELEFSTSSEGTFDDFVRHYLTVKTGDIPRLGDIYEAFKSYATARARAGETTESLVSELREYASRYACIALGREQDRKLKQAFTDLEQIRADVVYPLLLTVYTDFEEGTIGTDELYEIVQLVISYIFRRAVCRVPTNSLNKTFATLAGSIRMDRYLESIKAAFLRLRSYRAFPTDDEFLHALKTTDLYNFRRRSYLMRSLENLGRKERVTIEEYTIEHILPQNENLSSHWKESLGEEWERLHQQYLHTLGNLTLTGYNSEYSDHPFPKKRDMRGGFRESPLRLNAGLGQMESWNVEEIERRAERLAHDALTLWPRPVLPETVMAELHEEASTSSVSIEDHPHLLPVRRRQLFEDLSAEILAIDPGITRQFLKYYVAFKAETNFVDVIPQKSRLRLSLNIPLAALNDERNVATDVSGKGRWGNGLVEASLDEETDLNYVLGLIRQAWEYQIGGE
ncbi:DUF262 and DUF1524 domain-containing protein [Nesterenkonia massiliensis]|uniref:DUF262 and DUF1524 domain-containing protein n=1 Tax=Nesterenkonia massiliensis TaxID=1232429 RepID=UPI0004283B3D|nr:DUF262 and DUF1524 domain-containing protein [Nesterenkonia massiliensis]